LEDLVEPVEYGIGCSVVGSEKVRDSWLKTDISSEKMTDISSVPPLVEYGIGCS